MTCTILMRREYPKAQTFHGAKIGLRNFCDMANKNCTQSIKTVVCGTVEPSDIPTDTIAQFILLGRS